MNRRSENHLSPSLAAIRAIAGAAIAVCQLAYTPTMQAQSTDRPATAGRATDTLRLYSRADEPLPEDPNGFLLNPRWLGGTAGATTADVEGNCRFRVATGFLAQRTLLLTRGPCLSEDERRVVTLVETSATLGLGFICNTSSQVGDVRGHINWFPISATGQLAWEGFSSDPGDNDLSFDLRSPSPSALTTGNKRSAYHIEFNYRETLGRLPGAGLANRGKSWWRSYGDSLRRLLGGSWPEQSWWIALDNALENKRAMRTLVDGRLAIATGVFGLDGVHGLQSELHPVYAIFVLMDTVRTADGFREQWAVMARDLGNEGDCATGSLPLELSGDSVQYLIADLGWPAGEGAPTVVLGPSWSTDPTFQPVIWRDRGRHLLVAMPHRPPAPDGPDFLFLGTIYVTWHASETGSPLARFDAWLPSQHEKINLEEMPPSPDTATLSQRPLVARAGRRWGMGAVGRILAGSAPSAEPTGDIGPAILPAADTSWSNPAHVRAERVPQWLVPVPVIQGCPAGKAEPLCGHQSQWWSFAGVFARGEGANPFPVIVSPVYAYANALTGLGPFLSGFAYRVDVSFADRFQRACDSTCGSTSYGGWSVRLSPIILGTGLTFWDGRMSVTPYFLTTVGASALVGRRLGALLGAGVGLRFRTFAMDEFFELQNNYRTGGLEDRYLIVAGVHLDVPQIVRAFGSLRHREPAPPGY